MNKYPELTLEENLILLCIIFDKEEDTNQWMRVALAQREINWEYLIRLSLFHGIFPFLFDKMNKLNWLKVPKEIIIQFKKLWQEHMVRNIVLHSAFDHLMDQFSKKGIKVIPLKGVCWAKQLYPNENLRSFNDLDFLVKVGNLDSAKSLLKNQHYEPQPYIGTDRFPENSWNLPFYKRLPGGMKICVELHWGLARPRDYCIPLEQWWRNSHAIRVNGERFLSLSSEDLLLYLTINIHASKYIYLKQFIDLRQFLIQNKETLDWAYVEKSIKKIGLWSNFCFAISMAYKLFGDDQQVMIRALRFERLKRIDVLKTVLDRREIIRGTYGEDLRQFFLILLLNDRFNCILKSSVKTLFPSFEAIAYRYSVNPNSKMIYFWCLLDPFFSIFRLFKKEAKCMIRKYPL